MKSMKLFLTFLFCVSLSLSSMAGEGMMSIKDSETEQTWVYEYANKKNARNEWKQFQENWYYFGDDEQSKQNTWAEIDGKWYYFDQWSIMLHDTTTPDGHQVGPDGAWISESGTPVDTSAWLGTYKADDGQIITVKLADSNGISVIFSGYSEEGDYTQEYTLLFVDAAKKQAAYNGSQVDRDVYTLTEKGIEVAVEPAGGWKQGTYVKQ